MIEKIVMDVSKKLDVTLSRDFEGMVGMEAHLKKLNSILCLEYDEVKIIGIWGPAGIGKTTIARALYDQLSGSFPFLCFMGELKGSHTSIMGVDEHDSKLLLQNKLLSKILNRSDMSVNHLGAIKEWLHDKRVFIILDDVDDLEKLETLAKERTWFGLGSRIIVTTEDKKILKAHGINDIYHVDFPSEKEALEILCLSAFKQSYVQDGFEELANKVAEFCGNLPLGLCIVGSSLRGESKDEWELQLSRIETSLDRKVEDILRVGYDRLSDKAQSLFLHITCFFFDGKDVDYMTAMLADTTLDVKNGLKILVEKSLIYISFHGLIGMHYLLQQLGKQIVLQQSNEPGKRQFLVEFEEIRDVLKNETGTGSVIGISFDMYKIGKLFISKGAFKGMRNLKFLRIHNGKVSLLEDMEYLPHLRLLHWDTYPRKSLPPTFDPELLVELHMPNSKLEKLWGGIQPLANLKKIDLTSSGNLKEIPNLLKATSLETLQLSSCKSLLELPSSISNLHKLKMLSVRGCDALEVIPTNINLALLEEVDMGYCSSLRTFPDLSSNIYRLDVSYTKIEDVPAPVVGRWSHLWWLNIGDSSLKRLAHLPKMVKDLDLSNSDIRKIPDCVIGLHHLEYLTVKNCQKLVSIPGLAPSLKSLNANNCQSLKRVYPYFYNPIRELMFYNCLDLNEEARRGIIQQSFYEHICLPGREIPEEFTHKALGTSITIPLAPDGEGNFVVARGFKACVLLSKTYRSFDITCCIRSKRGVLINEVCSFGLASSDLYSLCLSTHLYIFGEELFQQSVCHDEVDLNTSEVHFEFTVDMYDNCKILECGVKILTEETQGISSKGGQFETGGNSSSSEEDNIEEESSSNCSEVGDSETRSNNNCGSDVVQTGRREDKTSIILGVVTLLCIFVTIHIKKKYL